MFDSVLDPLRRLEFSVFRTTFFLNRVCFPQLHQEPKEFNLMEPFAKISVGARMSEQCRQPTPALSNGPPHSGFGRKFKTDLFFLNTPKTLVKTCGIWGPRSGTVEDPKLRAVTHRNTGISTRQTYRNDCLVFGLLFIV
jgi:hypothetical protein